jgi:DNA invertase Pin-like site-specific DNA recombinase
MTDSEALFKQLRSKKLEIDDQEYFLRDDRLELGRLLIEGVEAFIPVAQLARATGISRETVYKLMRKYWQAERDRADTWDEWDSFEAWFASLKRSTTRELIERPGDRG